MRKSSKRVVFWTMLAAGALILALAGAVGASARDGHGRDDGSRAVEARGHDQENEGARQEDRGKDDAGDDGIAAGKPVFVSSLAPSVPSDPAIHGVAAGGAPWVLDEGSVRLRADGRIHVEVEGLVIPVAHGTFPAGTARPVTTVSASLYCAPDARRRPRRRLGADLGVGRRGDRGHDRRARYLPRAGRPRPSERQRRRLYRRHGPAAVRRKPVGGPGRPGLPPSDFAQALESEPVCARRFPGRL